KRTSPITIQSSPRLQKAAFHTSPRPSRNAPREAGINTRRLIHSMSCTSATSRSPVPAAVARSAKNWYIAAPPTQITAQPMCANFKKSYQVTASSEQFLELERCAHVALDL